MIVGKILAQHRLLTATTPIEKKRLFPLFNDTGGFPSNVTALKRFRLILETCDLHIADPNSQLWVNAIGTGTVSCGKPYLT